MSAAGSVGSPAIPLTTHTGRAEPNPLQLFRSMTLIRVFEERLLKLFADGKLMGTTHTSIGQEADAAAVLAAAEPSDIVVSNHRGHGHFLAHIGDVTGLMAEVMGKPTGVCGGIGGSQHLCAENRFYSNGIQGGIAPFSAGLALAEKRQGRRTVVICYMGDGTMGEGAVYEALNMAALWGAPVLYVLEHNGIAQTTPTKIAHMGDFCERVRGFGVRTAELHYPWVDELQATAFDAISHCRTGKPFFLLVRTQRLAAHSKGDDPRPKAELDALRARDPLPRLGATLSREEVEAAESEAARLVDAAYEAALAVPDVRLPPRKLEDPAVAWQPGSACRGGGGTDARARDALVGVAGKTVLEQLNQALLRIFDTHTKTVLIGEDILDPYGGAFKVTRGLATAHPERVMTSPISEAGITGIGAGMAVRGLRPIVEIMFGDFLALCADQLINHASKWPLMFGREPYSQAKCPLVVRTPMGGRRGYGPTHSQSIERLFMGAIGLRVIAPSHVHDVGALLEAAVVDDGPVLFVENKLLYNKRLQFDGERVDEDFEIRHVGRGSIGDDVPVAVLSLTGFEGEDVTLYTYGGMAPFALEAAKTLLLEEEISVRVVVPAELHPFPRATLAGAWSEGSAVLAVEEANADFGFGAELLATLAEAGCTGRGAARLGQRPQVIPSCRPLEEDVLPQAKDIVAAVLDLVRRRS